MSRTMIEEEICDFCGNSGFIRRCIICNKDFCISCEASIYNKSRFGSEVCKSCSKKETISNIINRYRAKFSCLYGEEKKELIINGLKLKKKELKEN